MALLTLCYTIQIDPEDRVEELEEFTANPEIVGAGEVTLAVGLLATTTDAAAGNRAVSLCTHIYKIQ